MVNLFHNAHETHWSHTIESKLLETIPFGFISSPVSTEFVKLFSHWEHVICWCCLKFQDSSYNKLSHAVLVQPLFKSAVWLTILLKKKWLIKYFWNFSLYLDTVRVLFNEQTTHTCARGLVATLLFQVSQLTFYGIFLSLRSKLDLFSMRALRKWLFNKFLCWKSIEENVFCYTRWSWTH